MTLSYQQQFVLDGLAARAAILDLDARYNRVYSAGDVAGWIATFRHSGATYTRGGETLADLAAAFDGGRGQRLLTVDQEISVDGIDAAQHSVALLFMDGELRATGTYADSLIYERGGWYFTSRQLDWDLAPRADVLTV
jgi:hypothetical protein